MNTAPSASITTRAAWPHLAAAAAKKRHDEVVAAHTRTEKPEWVRRIEAANQEEQCSLTLTPEELQREHRGW